jgi:AcrR family transcriptional regulator
MPRLWTETIEAHRTAVFSAILDTTASLAGANGLRSVTMSQVAEEVGIGRATLYKYFPDVEAILTAWHEREVTGHLSELADIRHQAGNPEARVKAVIEKYAHIQHEHHGTELAALLHQGPHVAHAKQHLTDFIEALIVEAVHAGQVRSDVPANELASYCLHALNTAADLPSKAAVKRLVTVTMAALRPLE